MMGKRNFPSLEKMNDFLISSINETVTKYDHLYILGDFVVYKTRDIEEYYQKVKFYFDSIQCKNVTLILGNHDHFQVRLHDRYFNYYKFDSLLNWETFCNNCNYISYHTNICKNCKSNNITKINRIFPVYDLKLTNTLCNHYDIDRKYSKLSLYLTHYSQRVFNKCHYNERNINIGDNPVSINLFGHSHGDLEPYAGSLDVGWDIWKKPISFNNVIDIIKDQFIEKKLFIPSHHE